MVIRIARPVAVSWIHGCAVRAMIDPGRSGGYLAAVDGFVGQHARAGKTRASREPGRLRPRWHASRATLPSTRVPPGIPSPTHGARDHMGRFGTRTRRYLA